MKKSILFLVSAVLTSVVLFTACQDFGAGEPNFSARPQLPSEPFDYEGIQFPSHFGSTSDFIIVNDTFGFVSNINPSNSLNPDVTNVGAELGRVLFYDPQLSINNSVSCSSCHEQSRAFADGLQGSVGFGGKVTPRNSMAIVNATINNNLFWDSRVQSLPQLILEPIRNHIEMGMEDLDILTQKLAAVEYYPNLFEKAYGDQAVTTERIADAVAQFLGSMRSVNSKFDKGMENGFSNFTSVEKLGKQIFHDDEAQCSSCHSGANFSAPDGVFGEYGGGSFSSGPSRGGATNIGLDLSTNDAGRGDGNFRIPTLRNIALTAPYMHDGRFATLEEVVEHYSSGIKAHPNLDSKFKNDDGSPRRLNLTSFEKQALIAFLHTLTDESFVKDERFSNPFLK